MLVFCSGSLRTSAISGWPGTALKKRLTSTGAQRRANSRCWSGVSFWSRKKMTPCSTKAAWTSSHWRLLIDLRSTPNTSAPQPPVSLRTCTVSYAMTLPPAWRLPSLHAEEQQHHRQSEDTCARRNDDGVGREADAGPIELRHQIDVGA